MPLFESYAIRIRGLSGGLTATSPKAIMDDTALQRFVYAVKTADLYIQVTNFFMQRTLHYAKSYARGAYDL